MSDSDSSVSRCPHIKEGVSKIDDNIIFKNFKKSCVDCGYGGARWLCLHDDCYAVYCGAKNQDHSGVHFQETGHSLQLSISRRAVWCNSCESQVYPSSNIPGWSVGQRFLAPEVLKRIISSQKSGETSLAKVVASSKASVASVHQMKLRNSTEICDSPIGRSYMAMQNPSVAPDSMDYDMGQAKGLTGLRNLGNTCYMNSAIQALSNCAPLSELIRCRPLQSNQRPIVADKFKHLLMQIWSPQRAGCVSPMSFLHAFTDVYKSFFRQFQQHDSQEFLRCFLDQMHQELKYPVYEWHEGGRVAQKQEEDVAASPTDESSSQSSASSDSFETADSGWSSEQETSSSQRTSSRLRLRKRHRSSSPLDSAEFNFVPERNKTIKFQKYNGKQIPKRKPTKFRSVINDVFDGKVLSTVTCLTCHHVSETRETFQDLSLAIPSRDHVKLLRNSPDPLNADPFGGDITRQGWFSWVFDWSIGWFITSDWLFGPDINLHDCFRAFFSKDELKGEDMYNCEKCKKLRNGVRQCSLLVAPEVLMVHLKRFRHEQFSSKVSTRVNFPLSGLDLSPFMHKECEHTSTKYDLTSVICHYGGADGGHYTAYCMNPVTKDWYEYDDSCVTQVDQLQVMSLTSEAYVLFYQKVDDSAAKIRAELNNKLSIKQRRILEYYISADWITKLNSFSTPGPITNFDFLCPHGCIDPRKQNIFPDLYAKIPAEAWDYLFSKFGGGPPCTNLAHCNICQPEMLHTELQRGHQENMFRNLERQAKNCGVARRFQHRCISTQWFKEWEAFVLKYQIDPPGPINNHSLLVRRVDKNTHIRMSSSYVTVAAPTYYYLLDIYGGGPEVVHRSYGMPQPSHDEIQEDNREFEAQIKNEPPEAKNPLIEMAGSDDDHEMEAN